MSANLLLRKIENKDSSNIPDGYEIVELVSSQPPPPELDSKTLFAMRSLLRQMVSSLPKQRGKRKFRSGHVGFDSVFGSNSYSYNSSGVFQFVNRVVVLNGLASSAGAIVAVNVALNPTVPSQWSSQSNLFDEYRIDEVRISFSPVNSNVLDGFISIVCDDDATPGTAVPASQDAMLQYGNAWWGNSRALPGSWCGGAFVKPYTYKCAPPSVAVTAGAVASTDPAIPLGAWGDIANAGNNWLGSIFVRGEDLSVSAAVATYVLEYVVQFRQIR